MQQSHRLWSFVLFWNRRKTKIVTFAVLQRILRVVCEFFLQWKQQRKKTTILVVFVAQPDIGVCMISPRCVRLTSAWSNILRRHRCRRHVSFIYLFFFSHFFCFKVRKQLNSSVHNPTVDNCCLDFLRSSGIERNVSLPVIHVSHSFDVPVSWGLSVFLIEIKRWLKF